MGTEKIFDGRLDAIGQESMALQFACRCKEGLENHEKLKRLLPFMEEAEGYL